MKLLRGHVGANRPGEQGAELEWSPDGTRIAFTSSRDGTNGVYTMNADGSDVRDVSRTPLTLAMGPRVSVLDVNESLWAWR